MRNTRITIPVVAALLVALGDVGAAMAQSGEVDAIKRAVRAETDAYFRRDADAWQRLHVQDSSVGGIYVASWGFSVNQGWQNIGPANVAMMKNSPKPVDVFIEDVNHRVRIDGALAFAEYDQRYAYRPDTVIRVARQHRVLVKRDGEWKIASWGIFDLGSFDASEGAVENRLSAAGRTLLDAKDIRRAIEVFKLNERLFPQSWRVHHSLAEAYAAAGETKLAIQGYDKSIAINADNRAGKEALEKLRGAKSP